MANQTNKKPDEHTKPDKTQSVLDEEFRILAEDAPVMLWLTNPEGKIIFTNSKWKKFAGVGTGEFVSGEQWYESLHPDDRQHCLRTFRDAFSSHQNFEMEYRLRRHDGSYRYVLDTGEPYINKEGKFSGFIGSSTDITDRKNSEDKLRHSERELTQYNKEMRLINELNSYLQVCLTLEETHSIVGHYAKQIFSDSVGALYLFNSDRTAVEIVAQWGSPDYRLPDIITPKDCWALRQSRVHIVDGKDGGEGVKCDHVIKYPDQGYICVPTIAQGEMIGFLHVEFGSQSDKSGNDTQSRSPESRIRLATITADNMAMALVSLKLREALRIQSVRDPITQLFNRRYMEETLNRELSRCKRGVLELGVIMLDIDHFKKYNDMYGHEVGDMVLKEVAHIVQTKLRLSDVACRYGGEEFILLMPGAPRDIIIKRAEQLRETIEGHTITRMGDTLTGVTVSIGVAIYPHDGELVNDLLKAADKALYQAKETGRNNVVISGKQ